MCVFGSRRCEMRGGVRVRGLSLGFTNLVGRGDVWDMCLCLGSVVMGGSRWVVWECVVVFCLCVL